MIRRTSQQLLLIAALVSFGGPASTARAAMSPIGAGENVVFSDEFADNTNNWSNVGTTAAIGADPGSTGQNVWYPTTAGLGETISQITLPTLLDISKGPIAIYMRVRVDDVAGGHSSKFGSEFVEQSPDDGLANQRILPGLSVSQLRYRATTGSIVVANIGQATLPNAQTFGDFRMVLTDNGDGSMTLEGFRYDTGTAQYVALGNRANADIDSGKFNILRVVSANGDADGRAYFDSVQITQIPEPATMGLMGLGTLLMFSRGKCVTR